MLSALTALLAVGLTFHPDGPNVGDVGVLLVDSAIYSKPSRESDVARRVESGHQEVVRSVVSDRHEVWLELGGGFVEATRVDRAPRDSVAGEIGHERMASGAPLPRDYEPPDLVSVPDDLKFPGYAWRTMKLRRESLAAFAEFLGAAREDQVPLGLVSCHRGADYQANLYRKALARNPRQTTTAPPGRSEHQLGTTADVGVRGVPLFDEALADTEAGEWILRNAERFGIVVTFSRKRCEARGVSHEPWHLRHVGLPLSPEEEW